MLSLLSVIPLFVIHQCLSFTIICHYPLSGILIVSHLLHFHPLYGIIHWFSILSLCITFSSIYMVSSIGFPYCLYVLHFHPLYGIIHWFSLLSLRITFSSIIWYHPLVFLIVSMYYLFIHYMVSSIGFPVHCLSSQMVCPTNFYHWLSLSIVCPHTLCISPHQFICPLFFF